MPTPLDELNEAVQRFINETSPQANVSTGFVLAFTTVRFEDHEDALPEVHGVNYAIGPGTSVAAASGMAVYLDEVMRAAFRDHVVDEDEE